MPARPASSGSAASSPPSSAPPTSSSFSSTPINPVVATVHSRRKAESSSWHRSDSQNQNAANSATADSPSSSGTQDEDIRSKLSRPSSAGSQGSSSSRSSKHEDGGRPKPPTTSQSQNQSLPSLSSGSAALLQLRSTNSPLASSSRSSASGSGAPSKGSDAAGNQMPPQSAANAGTSSQNRMASFRREVRAREEGNPLLPQDEDMEEDEEDVEEEEGDEDPSAPPSPTDRDVRIMFHGREVFAEDLIGLRVAKTFAGHGRFLGQVVKFDRRVALYTVVYADGDAEDLTVDSTLQILIQTEIERADPTQPQSAISLLFKKADDGASPASPDTGDFMMAPPQTPRQANPIPRRARIQVSEREAQFVVSLFENHALPSLMQQGWRSSSGRGEPRFLSPSGEVFPSALDVVGYIASDNELLTACFPANVHSAILSLLPPEATAAAAAPAPASSPAFETGSSHGSTGSASRKRTTSGSPSAEQLDGKRTRQARGGGYPLQMAGRGGGDTALYHAEDLDRRAEAASRISAYRGQRMGSRIRMFGDRLVGGEAATEARIQGPPEVRGYRRTASREPTLENPFASRWPGAESAEYARRFADSPRWRERGDAYMADRPLDAHPRNRIRGEGRYIHRMNGRTPAEGGAGAAGAGLGAPTDYYRDSTGSSPGDQGSPVPSGLAYSHYSARARAGEYRSSELAARAGAAPRAARETASFMSPTDTLGASAAFSMMDVERISKSRPGSAHMDQLRGRSPRQADGEQYESLDHHRRTSSGNSYHGQRGGDSHYDAQPSSEAQGEQLSAAAIGTGSTPSQQQHE